MFANNLLRTAIVALSLFTAQSGVFVDARASRRDKRAYPDIERAFYDWGDNLYW